MPRIYKGCLQLIIEKKTTTNNPLKEWAKDLNRHPNKAYTQMGKKPRKKCSNHQSLGKRTLKLECDSTAHLL